LSRNFVLKEDVVPLADVERIRGSIACVGHAVGRVRLILKKKDLATVRPGDVLVARMTSPDYLPAVQLAAAIVTDEGGITCHAAIVARELGKPCIIGTGVATRILKNDAVVEVDAMAGIVTVVERQSG
jgi:pyruvate,water dikinase